MSQVPFLLGEGHLLSAGKVKPQSLAYIAKYQQETPAYQLKQTSKENVCLRILTVIYALLLPKYTKYIASDSSVLDPDNGEITEVHCST